MSTIKPGDVMLTKSCRMVRVLASRDDGAVAMRDYRSRVAVRSVDTDRLSYHSEHELTLVQPPATPQEPGQPVKGYTLQALSNYFGWGLRDDRAIWRFIHERESLLRLCQSLLGTEKSTAQTAELTEGEAK